MPFVVDASVVASWLLPDERPSKSDAAYLRLDIDLALAPRIWWFEMRNILVVKEQSGRLDRDTAEEALASLAELPIQIENSVNEISVLHLSRRHRLTVYDACYLELAERQGIPLATLDRALAKAARQQGVPIIG
jgi:predicted nucleic acid-binding protein